MHTSILEINEGQCVACQVDTRLSFKPLMNHLEERIKTEHPIKAQFYRFLLERLNKIDGDDANISIAEIEQHHEVMVLIYTILTPLVASEKEFLWAMSTPVPDKIFFSTDAFYDFYTQHLSKKSGAVSDDNTLEKKTSTVYIPAYFKEVLQF